MKKSLLALAVLGAFTGVASAQSSVTIYGKVDLAYGHKAGVDINTVADSGAGSRLGFRGVEDLGGGLKAQFQIEHRFNPDDGTNAGRTNDCTTTSGKTTCKGDVLWHGLATVGLSHSNYGSINFGRQYTAAFSLVQNTIDPFNGDGFAELRSIYLVNDSVTGGGTTKAGIIAVRHDNSVRYDYVGSALKVAVAVMERANAEGTFTNKESTAPFSAAANYTGGALFLAAGIENPEGDDNYLVNLGAKYNFGGVTASLGYGTGKKSKGVDVSSWLVGARVPMGKADLKVGYATSEIDGQDSIGKFAIGVDYNLSKRSKVYADFARYSGDAVKNVSEKNAFLVGIQHNF
jgi:predicted porin